MLTFPGYDAHSPTLRPSTIGGDCMGPEFAKWKTAFIDGNAAIFSGDLVRLWIKYSDGTVMAIVKELHVTRDGRWWGVCNDGVFQLGTLVQPSAIEKVVALDESGEGHDNVPKKADEQAVAYFAELSRDAVEEWERWGKRRGIPFPGLAAVNYGGAP